MESFDSNCHSLSDSFSLYERYMRSFNVADRIVEPTDNRDPIEQASSSVCDYDSFSSRGNIDLSIVTQTNVINKHCETAEPECSLINAATYDYIDKGSSLDTDLCVKVGSPCTSIATSLLENSCATVEHSLLNDKSDPCDAPLLSEDSKPDSFKHSVFITSTMENSNNAVDSVPMFRDVRHSETVFKLPISELTFNGTLKHVQKLKPIVDPITALSSSAGLAGFEDKSEQTLKIQPSSSDYIGMISDQNFFKEERVREILDGGNMCDINRADKCSENTGDSQYDELNIKKIKDDGSSVKSNLEQSYSSLEASFDSGVRSPDMFSDENDNIDQDDEGPQEPFWNFLKDYEIYEKRKVRKIEESLQGVLPPPSVTTVKIGVTEMLKKYYSFLPLFNTGSKIDATEISTPKTPAKRVSFVEIPTKVPEGYRDVESRSSNVEENLKAELDTSANDRSIHLNMCSYAEAKETAWPDVLKCRYHDIYYNMTTYSERFELLALRYAERFVSAETETSVNIYSGGMQSPSSASKRKALRLMMAQAKSPGRRLSHLARRRQAFCNAATINEKAQSSTAKMVLIDKNFFPHRKLVNSSERKSPRTKRTPGKKTPSRKTPGKKTPSKTPTTRSGGSSRKKAMRRLLMDPENMTRSQPSRETLKRALFISPENRKAVPSVPSCSVPLQAMKSKRALFGSPDRIAETKSLDGTQSDRFLKRKLDVLDEKPENSRSKIAKSLSFGGDTIGSSQSLSFFRRASEVYTTKSSVELSETHKKKLLWAVSEALRVHGWRMSSPGFREKASSLARLTRRLLALPPHAARLAAPKLSTSETMLKLARQYVFAIIQGRSVDECFQEEQLKIANEDNIKMTGYISATTYQQMKAKQTATSTLTSQIKENTCNNQSIKHDQPKSGSKNILQDKLVNIDANSNSSSGLSIMDKTSLGLFKSNSMPSFEETAKMRARRQISFDNIDFPKR